VFFGRITKLIQKLKARVVLRLPWLIYLSSIDKFIAYLSIDDKYAINFFSAAYGIAMFLALA
jgi:hypothetical protein